MKTTRLLTSKPPSPRARIRLCPDPFSFVFTQTCFFNLFVLGNRGVEVGVDGRREIMDPVADQVVDAKGRGVVARRCDGRRCVGKRQRALRRGVDARDARVGVAPERAADAGGRDLVVGGVDVGAGLEDGVDGAVVGGGDVVAADQLELCMIR